MTVRRILTWGVPADEARLRIPSIPLGPEDFGSDHAKQAAADLLDTLAHHRALGVAAAQMDVDWSEWAKWDDEADMMTRSAHASPAMFALMVDPETDDEPAKLAVICNPQIVEQAEMVLGEEGCLSFGSIGEQLKAPRWLRLKFCDVNGKGGEMAFQGLLARAVWHETNHTRAVLMIDEMSSMKRRMFLKRLAKV